MTTYDESFCRNIGVITQAEQDIIKTTTVAIAGLGGIGGVVVSILARMGFNHFKIADIDTFDIKNINRQAASSHSVIGQKKVDVLKALIKDINPSATVDCYYDGVQEYNVADYLDGVDIAVDSIDYFCISARDILQNACERYHIPVAFSAPLGLTGTFLMFSPDSMSYNDYFYFQDSDDVFDRVIQFTIGVAPAALHLKYMKFDPQRLVDIQTGPSLCPGVHLGGAIIAVEILKYITKKEPACLAPNYMQIDLLKGKFVKRKLLWGNKGPFQQLKSRVAHKMYGQYKADFLKFIK